MRGRVGGVGRHDVPAVLEDGVVDRSADFMVAAGREGAASHLLPFVRNKSRPTAG